MTNQIPAVTTGKATSQQTERVLAEDIPTHPEPNGAADEDHPRFFYPPETTFSIRDIPLRHLNNHQHDASCYLPTGENMRHHDVAEDDYPGQNWDYKYVKKMSQDVDSLPLIVGDQDHGKDRYAFYGGGHRSAAHAEAGRSHIRMWVKDDQ